MLMDNPSLNYLSQIRDNLEHVDFDLLKKSISDLRDKFVPVARLRKGYYIDRVRINKNGETFTRKDQINYITDPDTLEKYVGFGRANFPKQGIFYGAIPTPKIEYPRGTAYLETTDFFSCKPVADNFTEIFTSGRWIILEDIPVMEMIFSDEALKESEYAQASLKAQTEAIQNFKLKEHYIEQGKFFSNEFSRDDCKGIPDNYKISAAYSNYVWDNSDVKGVAYPSVRTDFKGQNVALLPELVDKYLKLEKVAMFKFERINGVNQPIDSFKLATDLGKDQNDFQWFDYIGKVHQ